MIMANEKGRIEDCDGYKKLKAAVDADEKQSPKFHDYNAKLIWALDRAKHYAEKTGLREADILDSWEKSRDYWYMNYYQDSNLPAIEGDRVKVFDTMEALHASVGKAGFRCPLCSGVSKDAYACDSGVVVKNIKDGKDGPCNWKVYGLLGDLGKGVYVFVKAEMRGNRIFKPIAWESEADALAATKTEKLAPAPKKTKTKPQVDEASAAGFKINDKVGYKSSLKDMEFQHVGKIRSVHPGGIPSSDQPMVMIEGKSGTVLASHCTLIERA